MKQIVTILFSVFLSVHFISAQKVDSIKAEQSGDFIKIRYKILDSNPEQVFRIKVLCSINGGLNTELRSISGDAGDQVIGGKPEYWVVWDVLKDVDELKSVDFIIRAELVNDLSRNLSEEKNRGGNSNRFIAALAFLRPGPKTGFRVGYVGSFGFSAQFLFGKTPKDGNVDFDPANHIAASLDLTKRILNLKNFQTHLLAGYFHTDLVFSDPTTPGGFGERGVNGAEAGLLFDIKKIALSLVVSHLDPGSVEKGSDLTARSPLTFYSVGLGVWF